MMAAVVASSTAWRPSARPSAARCHRPRRSARVATRSGGNVSGGMSAANSDELGWVQLDKRSALLTRCYRLPLPPAACRLPRYRSKTC